jgi:DNA polymerase-3 subunit alpha
MPDSEEAPKLTEAQEAELKYPGPSGFVHLHSHIVFSPLDGIAKPDQYFAECARRGDPAQAITEHGVLSSIPDSYWAAKEHGIKYIPGVELYYNDWEPARQKIAAQGIGISKAKIKNEHLLERLRRNRHLTVLCQNMEGYANLLKINAHAWEHGFYYRPRTWFKQLAKHREGLIILSGCLNGPIAHEMRTKNTIRKHSATDYFRMFNEAFGENFYIEVQMPGLELEDGWTDVKVFEKLVELAKDNGKKIVLANDSHYMKRKDFTLQKTMMAISQGTTVDDPDLFHVNSSEQFFKTRAELRKTFLTGGYSNSISTDIFEEACDNTLELAERCEGFKPDLDPKLPTVDNADEKLTILTYKALKARNLHKDKQKYLIDGKEVTYLDQMTIELQRFVDKGFSSYFLIMKDLVEYARGLHGGDSIGPARGSAGGSLVCFLLGIHDMDPLKWKLSFDRFLSPARGGNMLRVMMK